MSELRERLLPLAGRQSAVQQHSEHVAQTDAPGVQRVAILGEHDRRFAGSSQQTTKRGELAFATLQPAAPARRSCSSQRAPRSDPRVRRAQLDGRLVVFVGGLKGSASCSRSGPRRPTLSSRSRCPATAPATRRCCRRGDQDRHRQTRRWLVALAWSRPAAHSAMSADASPIRRRSVAREAMSSGETRSGRRRAGCDGRQEQRSSVRSERSRPSGAQPGERLVVAGMWRRRQKDERARAVREDRRGRRSIGRPGERMGLVEDQHIPDERLRARAPPLAA